MNQRRPNQLLSPEEYLAEKNVKAVLNRIVMSLLETRPDNIERHIVNLLSTVGRTAASTESFPSYGGSSPASGGAHHGNILTNIGGPVSSGRRQSAISPDVLRNVGSGMRRRGISSRLTSSTVVEIKKVPKDETTFNALIATTKKVDLFSFLQDEQRHALVSAMFKKEFSDKEVIIREGDAPDNFYIIEKGKTKIYKKNEQGIDNLVATSTAGQYFGELALISGSTRAATVVADGDVVCWAIDQTTYLGLLKEQHGLKRQRYKQLLKNVSFLKVLQEYEILLVADALQSYTAKPDEVIVRQGDNGDEFFIIMNGECRILKKDEKTGEDKEIGTLKQGSYFGEVALLRNTPRTATIQAVGEVKLIKLDRKSFHRLLGPCAQLFQENMKHYDNKGDKKEE
ncbi:cAMP-dependent protein kinase type I-beta regulatory subunit [Tritrichomonas foetus]|uniref:cAMP-dependent protein kinase type I-beta regulatory subunit n=1 Tax=Tritrichomonas foetus TaxID=1144522 RepID=A0A1J4KC45_9EUKA|nr:cAMP-dependent protein kinase type I-beta regulatory subunit [Tritrichomonas foetus]|eukprot:OHT07230.1 cAMP-dependent protein kinase type I-beta regulatory subunit [Tritrichomonas foetus]